MTHVKKSSGEQAVPSLDYKLYSRQDYFETLARRISRCSRGDSVTLATMSFDPSQPAIYRIVEALCQAASSGAIVRFMVDAYIFVTNDTGGLGPLFYHVPLEPGQLRGPYKVAHDALQRLREHNVQICVINQPHHRYSVPITGRSHIKIGLINDDVYLGGCNLDYPNHLDMMVGWQDARSARWLSELMRKISNTGIVRQALDDIDVRHGLDGSSEILVDSGVRGQSVIYDQALELIDEAHQSVYLTSQYFPNGTTARHLKEAQQRGVKVTIVYNQISKNQRLPLLHHGSFWLERSRLPASFFENVLPQSTPYMHAKILATEQAALIGSHNYVRAGVSFGTAEIALLRHDDAFSDLLKRQFEQQLTAASAKL